MKILLILFLALSFIPMAQAQSYSSGKVDLRLTCVNEDVDDLVVGIFSDSKTNESILYLNGELSEKAYEAKLQTIGPKTVIQIEFSSYSLLINVTENFDLNDAYLKRPSSVEAQFTAQVMKHDNHNPLKYDAICIGGFNFLLK